MIIDAHTHIGFNDLMNASADDLIASMDRSGIDQSVVFACPMNSAPTELVLQATAKHRDRLAVVGTVSPLAADCPDVATVRRWFERDGICGLKFYLGYEHFYPADACLRPYLELCAALGKPAIFHTGDTWSPVGAARVKYAHPLHLDDLAVDLPELKIVMAHLGNPWYVDGQEVVYKNKNIFADCSGIFEGDDITSHAKEHLLDIMRHYALDNASGEKLLFGTDWPIAPQDIYLQTVADAEIIDREAYYSGNAKKLYGL